MGMRISNCPPCFGLSRRMTTWKLGASRARAPALPKSVSVHATETYADDSENFRASEPASDQAAAAWLELGTDSEPRTVMVVLARTWPRSPGCSLHEPARSQGFQSLQTNFPMN